MEYPTNKELVPGLTATGFHGAFLLYYLPQGHSHTINTINTINIARKIIIRYFYFVPKKDDLADNGL